MFADGALFLTQIIDAGAAPWLFFPGREFGMALSQAPVALAMGVGVTDLHWLAWALSFGLIAVPAGLYHLALFRAKRDGFVFAVTIAAIATVYMTTSFFAVGDYNAAYALAIAGAAWMATTREARPIEGIVLVVLATLALRTYQSFLYLGPVLAAAACSVLLRDWRTAGRSVGGFVLLWGVAAIGVSILAVTARYGTLPVIGMLLAAAAIASARRPTWRGSITRGLYLLASALFFAGAVVALDFVVRGKVLAPKTNFLTMTGSAIFVTTIADFSEFLVNAQFDLALAAAVCLSLCIFIRFGRRPVALLAAACLLLLALSPLLALKLTLFRPIGIDQYFARSAGGIVIAAAVALLARHAWRPMPTPAGSGVARRLGASAMLLLLASVPPALALTASWQGFLTTLRTVVRTQPGIVRVEDTALAHPPDNLLRVDAFLLSLSLVLRSGPNDALVVPPQDGQERDYSLARLPNLRGFFWHD